MKLKEIKKIKILLRLVVFAILIPISFFSQTATYSSTLDFNGTSTFVEIPSSNDLKFDSDKFTLEAWIKIENPPPSGSRLATTLLRTEITFFPKKMIELYIINVNGTSYMKVDLEGIGMETGLK